jgi:hypothetical protein
VGEAVNGGEGEEAVDPWRVMLNRPREAGEISKISRAVIACSTTLVRVLRNEDGDLPNPLEPACCRETRVKLLS